MRYMRVTKYEKVPVNAGLLVVPKVGN
jgi:hypothetical protein